MKVLIYMPFSAWIPHLATDLEIAAKHIDNGDDVHIIQCSGDLPSCEPNPNHFKFKCTLCKSMRDKGLNLLQLSRQNRHELALNKFISEMDIPDFSSIEELMTYKYDNVDVGMTVASTLISMVREPNPNLSDYKKFINENILMSLAIYGAIKYHIGVIKPDVFYLFNGRFATLRPALRAAQDVGVKTFVHERAGVLQRYSLTENTYPHDLEYQQEQIVIQWNDSRPYSEKEEISKKWFGKQRGGTNLFSHSKSTLKGNLPQEFDLSKRNIAIFISSEDEFQGIPGWTIQLYNNQVDAIKTIINADIDENVQFYLRIHPYLKKIKNTQTKELSMLNSPNLTIIPANSKIDSYELMEACEKVIVFGSTIGVESNYWGTPSILIGRALYEDLGVCYIPKNHPEVVDLINNDLNPLPKIGSIKFGYWQSVYGEPFIYYHPESARGGKFKGVYLGYKIYDRIKDKILSIEGISLPIINLIRQMRTWTWKLRRSNTNKIISENN